jgi:hypothetical protein
MNADPKIAAMLFSIGVYLRLSAAKYILSFFSSLLVAALGRRSLRHR